MSSKKPYNHTTDTVCQVIWNIYILHKIVRSKIIKVIASSQSSWRLKDNIILSSQFACYQQMTSAICICIHSIKKLLIIINIHIITPNIHFTIFNIRFTIIYIFFSKSALTLPQSASTLSLLTVR